MNVNDNVFLKKTIIIGLFVTAAILLIGFLGLKAVNNNSEINKLKAELNLSNSELDKVKKSNSDITEKYQDTYTQKNGTANEMLNTAVTKLIHTLYDYKTSDTKVYSSRRDNISPLMTSQALNKLLPNSNNTTPSVNVTSSTTKEPQIFLESTNGTTINALVMAYYQTQIEGATIEKHQFMYQIEFDSANNKISNIFNIGEVQLN